MCTIRFLLICYIDFKKKRQIWLIRSRNKWQWRVRDDFERAESSFCDLINAN